MGQVKGVTRRQLLERHYKEAVHDLNAYMEAHRQSVEKLINDYNQYGKSTFWAATSIPFGLTRGLLNGAIDLVSAFNSISTSLQNDISYLVDPTREEEWQQDLKYMFANLGATALEGVSAALFGVVADSSRLLFNVDTDWADNPIEGVIANFSRLGNQLRANALDENASAFSGVGQINRGFWANVNPRMDSQERENLYRDLDIQDMHNLGSFESRWQTTAPRPVGQPSNYFQEPIFEGSFSQEPSPRETDIFSERFGQEFKTKYGRSLPKIERPQEEVWTQEQLSQDQKRFAAEQFRYELFQDLVTDLEKNHAAKEVINKYTLQDFFQEKAGDNFAYKYILPVTESLGRLIPSFIMTKYAGGTGVGAQTMKYSSRAYFAASVGGGSMEEALMKGASVEDAFSLAFGRASLELGGSQISGIRLGVASSLTHTSKRAIVSTFLKEALEEMVIETGYRSLEFYANPNNEIPTGETRRELWDRVLYSGMVGGLSGFAMGSVSRVRNLSTKGQVEQLNRGLQQSIEAKGVDGTVKELTTVMNRLEKRLNSDLFWDTTTKQQVMSDPIASLMFNEVTSEGVTQYEISDLGKQIQQGNVQAQQGDNVITKKTHAVSQENFFLEYRDNVSMVNPETGRVVKKNIQVVDNARVQQSPHKSIINEVLKSNMNVAFVEVQARNVQNTPDGFDAFFDPDTGVTYININSEAGINNLLAHEVHDAISALGRDGLLTRQGRTAYLNFLKQYANNASNELFQALGVQFNEAAYAREYQGRDNFDILMETERVSAFLQQAMDNQTIIERGLRRDKGLFEGLASIFTRKAYYNKMLNQMGVDPKIAPNMARSLSKLERSFTNAIRANRQQLQKADSLIRNAFGQQASNVMFSLDDQSYEQRMKVKHQIFENFFDTQSGVDGVKGLNVEAFLTQENLTQFFDFYTQNSPTTYELINQDTNPQKSQEGYFVKINDTYYNQDAFNVHSDMFIKDIDFNGNSHYFTLEVASKSNPKNSLERFLFPFLEHNGNMIRNASMFEASIDLEQLQFMADPSNKKGLSPAQSFAVSSVAGNAFFTGSHGPVTFVLKSDISNAKDFNVFRNDLGSPSRNLEIGRSYIDLNYTSGNVWRQGQDLSIGAKMAVFSKVLDFNKYVAGPRNIAQQFGFNEGSVENVIEDTFNRIKSNDTSKVSYVEVLRSIDAMRMTRGNQVQTLNELKNEINIGQNLEALNILESYDKAVNSFETLVKSGMSLKDIVQYLNYTDMNVRGRKLPSLYTMDNSVIQQAKSLRNHFININEFINTSPYVLNNARYTSEGKMEVLPSSIAMAVINTNHQKVKGNPTRIEAIKQTLNQIQNKPGANSLVILENSEGAMLGKPQILSEHLTNQTLGDNVYFSMDSNKAKTLDNKSVEKVTEAIDNAPNLTLAQQQTMDALVNEQDFNDTLERAEVEATITEVTSSKFAQTVSQSTPNSKTKVKTINRFKQAQTLAKKVNKQNYMNFENTFADVIDKRVRERMKKPKGKLEKTATAIYTSLENVIQKQKTSREFYNHMASHVSKTVVNELITLNDLIKNDKQRKDTKPTDTELEYIARRVTESIFQTLDYIDSDVRIDINVNESNPNGYAFTKATYWYLRDMQQVQTWNKQNTQDFNQDGRGFAYRRLINAIVNLNKKQGAQELHNALRHFSQATRVENVSDLALDGNSPRTINNAKLQWEQNTSNIIAINDVIDYSPGFTGMSKKLGLNSWLDAFTVGETQSHFNPNGWAMVLNEKLVQATDRKLQIDRLFKEHFEAQGFLKKNYKNIVGLESDKNAIEIKNLGNVKAKPSQIIYLRNMLLRETIRNRAIDLGVLRGEKSNHFNNGNKIDLLGKSFLKDTRVDSKVTGEITNNLDLLMELDTIVNQDNFMREYNTKVMEFFNDMYPFINERFKEVNGINLQNDGQLIRERLDSADPTLVRSMFQGLPDTITFDTVSNIYVPFLLDNSGYFKQNKIDFTKGIIDMGVFDGMTNELTDSNAIINVESITDVVSSYARETANYYALHRVMNDFNRVLNERLDGYEQTTYVGRNIPKEAITFYENLLNDMAGYRPRASNPQMNRALSQFRKNFYRASLGANMRVIGSQVTTMFNLSNMYGSHFTDMFPKMLKNFFAQHTKTNKQQVQYLEENNNVYWDRKRSVSFEVGEATTQGVFANNRFNRTMQGLMAGIKFTDGSINRSLYLTLLDTINPETGQNFTQQEASVEVQKAILRSQSSVLALAKSPLLRTQNELFRVMLRFLGEPMKLITQSYNSAKQLQYLNKLEKNKDQVNQRFQDQVAQERATLNQIQDQIRALEASENAPSFNDLTEAQQKKIHRELNEARKREVAQVEKVSQTETNARNVAQQIDQALTDAPKAKNLARRRYTAFITATMYLTFLRAGFDLVRTKGGAKDRPDEQEFMEYLTRLIGKNFMDSLTGSFPFVRDAYQSLSSGFSSTSIAEFAAIDDLFRTSGQLIRALVSGSDVHVGRTVRNMSIAAGRLMGVPANQIERLFTTPTLYVNESLHYRYQAAVGRRTRDNIELRRAIERGDTKMIEAVVDNRINQRNITVSNPVSNELVRLSKSQQEVRMSGVRNSFTVNGETFEMTRAQRHKFAEVYNKADLIIQKMIKSVQYRRLNDDKKRSLLQFIYTYYYNLAKQTVSGVEIIPERNMFRTLQQAYNHFMERANTLFEQQRSPSYIQEQRKKALAN